MKNINTWDQTLIYNYYVKSVISEWTDIHDQSHRKKAKSSIKTYLKNRYGNP